MTLCKRRHNKLDLKLAHINKNHSAADAYKQTHNYVTELENSTLVTLVQCQSVWT